MKGLIRLLAIAGVLLLLVSGGAYFYMQAEMSGSLLQMTPEDARSLLELADGLGVQDLLGSSEDAFYMAILMAYAYCPTLAVIGAACLGGSIVLKVVSRE